jgi:hypothetical protein
VGDIFIPFFFFLQNQIKGAETRCNFARNVSEVELGPATCCATISEVDTQRKFAIAGNVARIVESCVRTMIMVHSFLLWNRNTWINK